MIEKKNLKTIKKISLVLVLASVMVFSKVHNDMKEAEVLASLSELEDSLKLPFESEAESIKSNFLSIHMKRYEMQQSKIDSRVMKVYEDKIDETKALYKQFKRSELDAIIDTITSSTIDVIENSILELKNYADVLETDLIFYSQIEMDALQLEVNSLKTDLYQRLSDLRIEQT